MKKIITLKGSLLEEVNFDLRRLFPESCALAAAVNITNAAKNVHDSLVLQEHRGEKSTGIISVSDGTFYHAKAMGRARNSFMEWDLEKKLPGKTAIGHGRYATQGAHDSTTNIQPLFFHDSKFGPFAIAHNGTLADIDGMKERMMGNGVVFQSTTDSELFGHLIAQSNAKKIEEAVIDAANKIKAAYSLLILTPNKMIAIRDRFGVRPLSIGKLNGGYLICSESYVFDQYPECVHVRDVEPGEMIIFEEDIDGFRSAKYANDTEHFCVFESIYFSHPRTKYNGFYNEDFRMELGKELFRENPELEGDAIVPILDSGKHAAWGLAEASGIPYREYFLRIHAPPNANLRSFTSATTLERKNTAHMKLHLRKEAVKGKKVVTVDDSIVRSTTVSIINKRLREAGAAYIVNCVSAPSIVNICPYGMDFQDTSELIAYNNSIDEIRQKIGSDELIYLSFDGLKNVVKRTYARGICSGCFGGKYPLLLKKIQ